MTALLLGAAITAEVPFRHVLLVVGAVHRPIPTAVVVLILVAASSFRSVRDRRTDPAVGRVVSVAGDLRAGKPLRSVVSSGVLGDRLASIADSGRPIRAPLGELSADFGADALLVQATLELAAEGGGPVADTFDRLAADMIESDRTRRERRAALAPAMAQAVVVGGVPAAVLIGMLASGRWLTMLSAGPVSAAIALFGTFALLTGTLWIVTLVERGRRRWR